MVLKGERRNICLATLLNIFGNVAGAPAEPKFRTIRAENTAFKTKVLACAGGHESMLAAGFKMSSVAYVLPHDADLASLQQVHDTVQALVIHGRRTTEWSAADVAATNLEGPNVPYPKVTRPWGMHGPANQAGFIMLPHPMPHPMPHPLPLAGQLPLPLPQPFGQPAPLPPPFGAAQLH